MCITEQQDDWMTMKRAVPAHWGRILNYCRRIDEIRIESPGSCDRDNASHCQAVSFSLAQSKLTKKQEATSSASELVKMGATDWQCQKKTETDPATAIRTNLNADSKPFFPRNMTATNPSQGTPNAAVNPSFPAKNINNYLAYNWPSTWQHPPITNTQTVVGLIPDNRTGRLVTGIQDVWKVQQPSVAPHMPAHTIILPIWTSSVQLPTIRPWYGDNAVPKTSMATTLAITTDQTNVRDIAQRSADQYRTTPEARLQAAVTSSRVATYGNNTETEAIKTSTAGKVNRLNRLLLQLGSRQMNQSKFS